MPTTKPLIAWRYDTGLDTAKTVKFDRGGVVKTATLTAGTEFLVNQLADAKDVLKNIKDAMNAADGGQGYDVTLLGSTAPTPYKVRIDSTGATFKMLWTQGTFDSTLIGFTSADEGVAVSTRTATSEPTRIWTPDTFADRDTDKYQVREVVSQAFTMAGTSQALASPLLTRRNVRIDMVPPGRFLKGSATAGVTTFESFWEWASKGERFWFWEDGDSPINPAGDEWVVRTVDEWGRALEESDGAAANLMFENFERYSVRLPLAKYVSG